jgi:hypothetical protein
MLFRHTLEFVPIHRGVGWSINDEGQPRVWWRVRLSEDDHLVMSDGGDAHELEADVQLTIGGQVEDTPPKRGVLIAPADRGALAVHLAVSRETFDRVLQAVQGREPPTVVIGFGPEGRYKKLTTGPITTLDDEPSRYRWDDAKEEHVAIEACEFQFSRAPEEPEAPEIPDKPSAAMRAIGISWGIAVNLLAVLIAFAVLNVAATRFETAVVSVLLLIYIYLSSSNKVLAQMLMRTELAALAQFYQLRALMGVPASDAENKFMKHAGNKIESPGYRFWIDSASSSIIGLVVLYRLASLLL